MASRRDENVDEAYARQVLESVGVQVTRLATDDVNPTADFQTAGLGAPCVIEVKGREVSKFVRELVVEADREGIASGSRPLAPRNRVDAILTEASTQVDATRTRMGHDDFGVVWISCLHDDVFLLDECFRTLYGLARINVFDDRGQLMRASKPCFFYYFNSFFDLRGIDAAVLASREKAVLCLNPFSRRHAEFARTDLVRSSIWHDVVDPLAAERRDDAFVIDRPVNRKDPHALWQIIKEKYGVLTSPMIEGQWLGVATKRATAGAGVDHD